MLLNASPPYTACSPYFYNPKRQSINTTSSHPAVGWAGVTEPIPSLEKAYPPTQTPHIRPVGWLLNALLIPMLLNASPPYTACSPYFYNPKRHPASNTFTVNFKSSPTIDIFCSRRCLHRARSLTVRSLDHMAGTASRKARLRTTVPQTHKKYR